MIWVWTIDGMMLTVETEARGEKTFARPTFFDTRIRHGLPRDWLFSSAVLKYATHMWYVLILLQHDMLLLLYQYGIECNMYVTASCLLQVSGPTRKNIPIPGGELKRIIIIIIYFSKRMNMFRQVA